MSNYEKQDYFNSEIYSYLQQELFGDIFEWPEGVTIEECETKPCDLYQKWSEGHILIKIDGKIAAEMNMGGKYGDSIKTFKITNMNLLVEIFKRMLLEGNHGKTL